MLSLTHLLRIPRVDAGFDISPDDSKIAFAWNKTGEWQIYELYSPSPNGRGVRRRAEPVEAGEGEIQLTQGIGGKFNPRYSPDGKRLAYVLDVDGSERYHLIVYDFESKQHTDLTPNISHALQPNFCWSPDGSQLAFLSDEHGHFCTYIISVNGGDAQLILDTGHPAWEVEWSPDGKHLAVCCEMQGQDHGIFVVEVCHPSWRPAPRRVSTTTSEILRSPALTPGTSVAQNDIPLNAHAPHWSPDGKRLSFHSDLHGWFDVGIYDVELKEISWVTNGEGDSQNACWSEDGQVIAYVKSKGAVNWIEMISVGQAFSLTMQDAPENNGLATRSTGAKRYPLGKGIHEGIRLMGDAKRMVTTFSNPSQPCDLWMSDIESGEAIQLTHSMPEGISQDEFTMPEEIFYEGIDGVEIPALLFRPLQMPAPAVVMIHGGPNWHYAMEWNAVMAHFASRGFVVLCPNYRGSTGYGRAWQYAARFDLGGVDTRDVAAGAQYLIREGLAIENKIAVTGRSHGGYLTMTCMTQFPELWCAGSAVVPFVNWFKTHEKSREDVQHWDIENMGNPMENYERWYNASPYFFLERVNAPVQLICGGLDPRCPAEDSLEARDKLIELGKAVELLLYEDEGHAFLKQKNILDAEVRRAEFLVKYIGG